MSKCTFRKMENLGSGEMAQWVNVLDAEARGPSSDLRH